MTGGCMLRKLSLIVSAISLIYVALWGSQSDTTKWEPNKGKDLEIVVPKLSTSPKIDGRLDENTWQEATRIGNFTEIKPGDNVRPRVETEVLLGYDDEKFYVGFVCYDTNVREIRATLIDRDEFRMDDLIWVDIDTFNDLQRAYGFTVNPCGVQGDQFADDWKFDTNWESAAKILDDRWEAEIAIPFKSLRFPPKEEQCWRVHFTRFRPRESTEVYSWAPISRDNPSIASQAGYLWINERISTSRDIEFLPYVVGAQTGVLANPTDRTSLRNDRGTGNIGLSIKYGLTSNLTLDLALNPDYSQIESDVTQIDVNTTFALFYPEKRPFFLEGKDIFETPIDAIYTRSTNDPLFAAKLTGKIGRTSIGYIIARDEHTPWVVPFEEYSFNFGSDKKSLSNILRAKQDILKDSYVGALITDRELSGSFNRVIGIDGSIRFKTIYNLSFQTLGSWTKEPNDTTLFAGYPDLTFGKNYSAAFDGESFSGVAYRFGLNRSARYWNFNIYHQNLSPTFRADDGFIEQNNHKKSYALTWLTFWPNKWMIEQIQPGISAHVTHNYRGVLKDQEISPSIQIQFKGQTSLSSCYTLSSEYFAEKRFDGLWNLSNDISTSFSKKFWGGVCFSTGKAINYSALDFGYERSFGIFGEIKPISRLRAELMFNRYWLWEKRGGKELYDVFVLYNKTTYQFSKHLSLRLVTQYYSSTRRFQFNPLLSYEPGPFTVFYIGLASYFKDFGDPDGFRETDHQFFVKFQYLFRTTADELISKAQDIF